MSHAATLTIAALLATAMPAVANDVAEKARAGFADLSTMVVELSGASLSERWCHGTTCEAVVGDGTGLLRLWHRPDGKFVRADALGFTVAESDAWSATCQAVIAYVAGIDALEASGVLASLLVELASTPDRVDGKYFGTFVIISASTAGERPECRAGRPIPG